MKRCSECRRNYYDDSLLYCLDDGIALLEGPAGESSTLNEPATAIFKETAESPKSVAFARGTVVRDVVLITDTGGQ